MTATPGPYSLFETFVHIAESGAAAPIPVGENFWMDLSEGRLAQLETGRLISSFSFDVPWNSWESHPEGEEVVVLLRGTIRFILEQDGVPSTVELRNPGSFLIIPRGAWHRAETSEPSSALFITPGRGTQHRPVVG